MNSQLDQLRFDTAVTLMQSIIAADWKFDVSEKTWDELAVERALTLTDLLIEKLKGATND